MRSWATLVLVIACFATLFLTCYGRALFGGGQFGYRDAGHYYYPLHQRVQTEWNAGRWPLWEPEENAGMPLLGNPTAAVLYPGKIIFAILPYAWAARFYIVAHTALAFVAVLVLLRSWQTSWIGSALAALSYAFGAPVLCQISNVIYLVGAAWLPLGLHAVDQWVRLGRRRGLIELAIVLSMQTLGGEPESAYLLGLAAGGYVVGMAWTRGRPVVGGDDRNQTLDRSSAPRLKSIILIAIGLVVWIVLTLALATWLPRNRPRGFPPVPLPWMAWLPIAVAMVWACVVIWLLAMPRGAGWRFRVGVLGRGLAASAVLAALLSAAQLLPVLEFSRQTIRNDTLEPHDIYMFSIEPFRLAELAWPNILGTHFGTNTYWRDAFEIPGVRPELWSQSLYVGGLTLVLAFAELARRRGPSWRVWLSAIVVVSVLASLGRYASPLWAARAALQALRWPALADLARSLGGLDLPGATPIRLDGFLRDGDGGVYWWLTALLPGFRQFRFPAKLFTLTALGLSCLAGLGWDRVCARDHRRVKVLLALLLIASLATLACVVIARPLLMKAVPRPAASSTFGPIDYDAAFRAAVQSLMHAAVVAGIGLLALRVVGTHPRLAGAIVLLAMTADLAAANTRFVLTVPQSLMDSEPDVLRAIADHERKSPTNGPFRVHRMAFWEPQDWLTTASPARADELVSWHRDTLYPKHGINLGVEYTHVFGVGGLADFEPFFRDFPVAIKTPEAARMLGVEIGQRVVYCPRRSFDIWNTVYFILPADSHGWLEEYRGYASFLFHSERVYPNVEVASDSPIARLPRDWVEKHDVQVLRNLDALPRAWVVHDARWVNSADTSRTARDSTLREILFGNDPLWHDNSTRPRDPRTTAWVDIDKQPELSPFLAGELPKPTETIKVTYPTPQRVELDASLQSPGVVVLSDLFYPGWRLTIDGKDAPIYPVNRLMRGAAVAAGVHKLVYTYEPLSFRVGRAVSIVGICALAILCVACAWSPVDRRVEARVQK